jgi:hypothetical protein
MTKGCLSAEVISHEAVHAAVRLTNRSRTRIRRMKNPEETLAFWVGQLVDAIVGELYRVGLYKRRK